MRTLTKVEAKKIGDKINLNWDKVNLDEFTKGINIELEHETRYPGTDISCEERKLTGKIASENLLEFPDYYTRLEKIEEETQEYWEWDEAI